MSQKRDESELAQETIRYCTEALMDIMATFRTYSGKHLDIDRGDFDVEFFKELHGKCSAINNKLQSLASVLAAPQRPRGPLKNSMAQAMAAKLSPVV
jgi:hypothetical protein